MSQKPTFALLIFINLQIQKNVTDFKLTDFSYRPTVVVQPSPAERPL